MTNRIVCMRWGKVYTDEHVEKLFDRVSKMCSVPFEFTLFDNVDNKEWNAAQKLYFRGLDDPDQRAQGSYDDFERDDCGGLTHYRKLLMFVLDIDEPHFNSSQSNNWNPTVKQQWSADDTILYLDLDSIILGDLAWFFDQDMSKPWIVKSYWFDKGDGGEWKRQYHLRRCPYFNSSVLLWKPGQNRRIFDLVNNNLNEVFFTYGGNDNFMFHLFGPYAYERERREHFNVFPPGIVTSQKYSDPSDKGIIRSLEGMSIAEKNKLCFR